MWRHAATPRRPVVEAVPGYARQGTRFFTTSGAATAPPGDCCQQPSLHAPRGSPGIRAQASRRAAKVAFEWRCGRRRASGGYHDRPISPRTNMSMQREAAGCTRCARSMTVEGMRWCKSIAKLCIFMTVKGHWSRTAAEVNHHGVTAS